MLVERGSPSLRSVNAIRAQYADPGMKSKTEYHLAVMEDRTFAEKLWSRINEVSTDGLTSRHAQYLHSDALMEPTLW